MAKEMDRVRKALADVREYEGMPAFIAMVTLLEELQRSYEADLLLLTPDNLARKQGAAQQCAVLHRALTDKHQYDFPKVG